MKITSSGVACLVLLAAGGSAKAEPGAEASVEGLTRAVTRMLAESPVNELDPWKPRFTRPKEFFVMPAEKLNYDERLTAMALAGLMNRNGPRLFLRGHFAFNADADRFWLDRLAGKYAMPHTEINLDKALAHFHSEVRGAVVCDDKLPATEAVGLTLAGALGCVPAMPSMLPRLEAAGIPVAIDLRGVWTDHLTPQAWVLDTVGKRLDRRLVGLLNLRGKALGGIVDYLVMHGALVADLSSDQGKAPEEYALRDRILDRLDPGSIVWGWHGNDSEYQFVDHASKRGLRVLCATNCPNLSFLSQVRPAADTWRQRSPAPDDRPVEKKLYMTFVLTDGDSIPILLTKQWYRWDDPVRGTIPFGWEHQPLLADLAPMVFEYYYDTMTENDQLICGPSGAGYTHPGVMPNLDWFAYETNRYLRRTNLRSIGVLGDWNEQAARTMAGRIPEAVGFLYGWAEEPDRPQLFLHGKPYVPYWFSLDQPGSGDNGGKDAAYYARQAAKIRRIVKREGLPCFLGAHLSCYLGTPGDVPKLLEALGNEIPHELLLPDQFLHMAGKHFGK